MSAGHDTKLDKARNELLSHINRCGVLDASKEQQQEWMDETVEYLHERYPSLTSAEMEQLQEFGLRFCRPIIPHGNDHTAGENDDANAA